MKRADSGFEAEWPAPEGVRTWVTTRSGGVSSPPYDSLNLATHVGDRVEDVRQNRRQLREQIGLPTEPVWLNQIHQARVVELPTEEAVPEADGSWCREPGVVCAVLTADCLPILITNRSGSSVAALHAGWRGLAAGIIEQGVHCFSDPREELLVWVGPSIGHSSYEVGSEVREQFCLRSEESEEMFLPSSGGRWLASMPGLARQQLSGLGVTSVYGGEWDTFKERGQFFSYRRDGETGRFATLIWLE